MATVEWTLVLCVFVVLLISSTKGQEPETQLDRRIFNLETELAKLRMLHQQRKDRIQFLERELNHYYTIFQGVELLCSTLDQYRQKTKPFTTTTAAPVVDPLPTVSGITASKVETVISSIRNTQVVQVSVYYITTENHEIIWAYNVMGHMIPVKDGDPYSSYRDKKNGESFKTTLTIDMKDLESLELVYVKILSEFSEVTILFNKTALLAGEGLVLSSLKIGNEQPVPEVLVLDPAKNASISLKFDTNINSLVGYVNFIGINTTTQPQTLVDLQSADKRILSYMQNTTNGYLWTVTVDSSLVDTGGMVSLRVVDSMKRGPILQVHVGKTLYIIPDKAGIPKSPFPEDSLALLSLYKHTGKTIAAEKPIAAIWCYAFGNPVPKTSIYKLSMNGHKKELSGYVYNIGKYDEARVSILKDISAEEEGTYMCEAISGTRSAAEIVNLYLRS